jgi:acetyltransferase-like isoleucine patch superfamily enzyme
MVRDSKIVTAPVWSTLLQSFTMADFHQKLAQLPNALLDTTGQILGAGLSVLVGKGWVHFPFISHFLSRLPGSIGWKMRRSMYACLLRRCEPDVILHEGVVIEDERSSIGRDVWVSFGAYIDYAEIGDHVLIGPHAVILSHGGSHHFERIDLPVKLQGNPPKTPLVIGEGAWIGANATVTANVGAHSIVGAGAVVTKPVPAYAIVAGNPARLLRMRTTDV